ncbi:MAG: hypothetical protein PW788_10225 [Micavibrio sp.]|nr:hypothetical protein [Micavibrio sp.]
MTVFLAAFDEMEMFFNGPMRSGIVLDSQALLNAGYRNFQEKLAQTLTSHYMGTWECPQFLARRNKMAFDVDNFQGETIIPRYLISRSFSGENLAEILEEFRLPPEVRPLRGMHASTHTEEFTEEADSMPFPAKFRLEKLDIYLYDYGYASCLIRGKVVALRDMTLEEYRAAVEYISSSLPDYTELFQSTIAKVAKVIPPEYIILSFHGNQPLRSALWPNTSLRQHIGELFWVHRIFSIRCKTDEEFESQKETCRALAYSARNDTLTDIAMTPGLAIYPGNGNSCVVYKEDTPDWNVARLRSVIRAKNVFYAALQDVDRDLFYLNNELSLRRDNRDMASIERQMQYTADCLARTGFIKSVYDDYDNQLDPQSIGIWDHLRVTWIMGDMFRAIDQKTAMLDKVYDRLAQRLQSLQSRRISQLIVAFIAIALVTMVLDLVGVVPKLNTGDGGGIGMTLPVIVLAFALGAATLLALRHSKPKK